MTDKVEMIATAVRRGPHSFDYIRSATGLELTDDQFRAVVTANRKRFRLVRFMKRDDAGELIRPGRPGVQLRAKPA
jgi:hypothetical protein